MSAGETTEPVIGIDLGTTNSVVAAVEDGSPAVITSRAGYKLTPSVVAVSRSGKRLVGHLARRQAITNATQTVFAAKRLIGRKWSSPRTAEVRARAPYTMVEGPHDDIRVRIGDQDHSLPEISAMVLTELRLDAETHFGCPVTKAVITVPAYFNDAQRQATKDAGRIAGLDVLRIINEPTAAALAYGFGRQTGRKIAVFDLGGGTLDVSILDISNDVFDVIATHGDTYLGGEDFDARIIDWLAAGFEQQYRVDLRQDRMALQRLKDAAEKAKCELSSTTQVEMNLPFIMTTPQGNLHLQTVLTREQLEKLTEDLVRRSIQVCREALEEAKLRPQEIEDVLLVGGQSRMPRLQEAVAGLFGREASRGVHPEEVVALGAAIQGRALAKGDKAAPPMLLLDVTPHSLGMMVAGGLLQVLVPRNTTVPTSASHLFTTVKDHQNTVRIMVLQGEDPTASKNELLGEFMLTGLRPALRGEVSVEVIFDISADGIVSVSARDVDTGLQQSINVTATTGLSEDELERMTQENAEYLVNARQPPADGVRAEVEALVRELDGLSSQFRDAVAGSEYGADIVNRATTTIEAARQALDRRDRDALAASKEALERMAQVFKAVVQRIAPRG